MNRGAAPVSSPKFMTTATPNPELGTGPPGLAPAQLTEFIHEGS